MRLIIVLLLISYFQTYAQIGFQEHSIINTTGYASSPHSVDLDGDGDMDVLCAAPSSDKVAWYENTNGLGDFGPQKVISTDAMNASAAFATDVDGDGDMDVLSASPGDGEIRWYENIDGQGNFGIPQIITTNIYDGDAFLYAADIDGDGDVDVLASSHRPTPINYGKITLYKNLDGLGTFGVEEIISTSVQGANGVYADDIDNDGDMDVLSSSWIDSKIAWYENTDGQGNFGLQQVISNINNLHFVITADVNGDGSQDVLTVSKWNSTVYWYENLDGIGTFGSEQIVGEGNLVGLIYPSDIDDDGDIDVFVGGNQLSWYENTDGLGTFSAQQLIEDENLAYSEVYPTDLDGDGDMDVLTTHDYKDKIAWFENIDGQGTFGAEQIITSNGFPWATIATDLDGDGDLDVVNALQRDEKLIWNENLDGQGTFGAPKVLAYDVFDAARVVSSDLDGDGDIDIIFSSWGSSSYEDKLGWHENTDGLGNFGPEQIIEMEEYVHSIDASDLDGDGDMDILITKKISGLKIAWFENVDGQGTFSEQIISTISGGSFITSADLDGDNDLDVLYASQWDDKIAWYENTDGQGNFGTEQILTTTAIDVDMVYAADIDNDGDLDVLYSSEDKVAWFENTDGQGIYNQEHYINEQFGSSVIGNDIDSDGDIDVIYNSQGGVVWQENIDSQGTFGLPLAINDHSELSILSISAVDINDDGKLDVLSNYGQNGLISWSENLGITSNKINGIIRLDLDANGCNADDLLAQNIMVQTNDGMMTNATFSLSNGLYQFYPLEGNHTTTIAPSVYYSVNPNSYLSSFIGIGNTDIANFCLEPIQVANDLVITLLPLTEARPGFNASYRIVYHNIGTTHLDGSTTLVFNSTQLNFLTASETVSSQTVDTLIFDYSGLAPYETRSIDLEFNVINQAVEIDDVLTLVAIANPLAIDFTPENNNFTLNQVVIGSFDPNDITVLEGDQISINDIDKYLHYVIRFQNTGTASAINVNVNNILDAKLNWETLQLENTSHTGKVEIVNGNDVTFVFDNIYLADSLSNEPESHGFIAYKIKPKTDIVIGDVIFNEANIYFDFNAPVLTNMVSTEIIVVDMEAPIVICQNTNLELDSDGNATIEPSDIDNGSSDNTGIVSLTVHPNTFNCEHVGNINVTLVACDAEGNIDSCVSVITLLDNIAPTVEMETLSDVFAECELNNLPAPSATDNCAGILDGVHDVVFPITDQGTFLISWSFDDGNGNDIIQTQNVTIDDTTPPSITSQNITIDLEGASSIEILPSQIDNGSTDNCDILQMSLDINTFTSVGVYTVVFSVEDVNNNISTVTATVTVVNSSVGVSDNLFANKLSVYPNPASNTIVVKADTEKIKSVIFYNELGEKIKTSTSEVINISELSSGVYLLEITSFNERKAFKKLLRK